MRKKVFGISLVDVSLIGITLVIALVAAGCAGTQQRQLHKSLLLHENRQLEDALFVSQARIADLQRENDALRRQQTGESRTPPGRPRSNSWLDDWEFDTPLEMPTVILPGDSGTTEIPESLRGSHMFPVWMPVRQ